LYGSRPARQHSPTEARAKAPVSLRLDSYRTSRASYREIACLVAGSRTSSVVLGAAPSKTWAQQAGTIERAIASVRTD
jgi:hypothetical protein